MPISATYEWQDRWGNSTMRVTFQAEPEELRSLDDFDDAAKRCGWPGHQGGFWRFLLADIRALFRTAN